MKINASVTIGLLAAGLALGCYGETSGPTDDTSPGTAAHVDPAAEPAPASATVGKPAPDFELPDLDGKTHRLSDLTAAGKLVVLEWFNPDCPIARTYHDPSRKTYAPEISMAATFAALKQLDGLGPDGVAWLAINSGSKGHSSTGVERNARARDEFKIAYPILLDETGEVGKRYAARATPHMFVIDERGVLIYDGAIDDGSAARPGAHNLVLQAVRDHVAGRDVATPKTEAFGCSVKYGS